MGYDAGKQVKGRKIHALGPSEGLPMRVVVHSAAIQDRDGAGPHAGSTARAGPASDTLLETRPSRRGRREGAVRT